MTEPRWIITYHVDSIRRDRDNYPYTDTGEPETAEGDTLKEAIQSLLRMEVTDGLLRDYVDPGYDYYRTVEIVSIYKVIKEVDLNFFEDIPIVKQMIGDMKETIKQEKAKLESDKAQKKEDKEKKILKELLTKYGTP